MRKRQKQITVPAAAPRDVNILKCATGELNLGTRCTAPNKKIYRRKEKHSSRRFDY